MSDTFDQGNRALRIECSIPETDVVVTSFAGVDRISTPFAFKVVIVTKADDDEVFKLLGQTVTIHLNNLDEHDHRPVHGRVRGLSGPSLEIRSYRTWEFDLVPQLSFLDYSTDLRIFQTMSVTDILTKVFSEHELTDYEFRGLVGTYKPLDYCVQYRETAFAFVSRLMEHAGLFYWHEHADGSHKLVIADFNKMAKPAMDRNVELLSTSQVGDVGEFAMEYRIKPGKWTQTDYNFETPSTSLQTQKPTLITDPPMSKYETYDYPGLYGNQSDGSTLTRTRIEREEAAFQQFHGIGLRTKFDAGRTIEFEEEGWTLPHQQNRKFLLLEVSHKATNPLSQVNEPTPFSSYENRFVALSMSQQFRSERITPKPRIAGVQTAQVMGPAGEKIHCDKYGRVKIRFFWDRNPDGKADENRTCWVRVSQTDAHKGWGSMVIPRIGEEVIVAFVDGDPDRPIIVGSLYNGEHPTPFELPANKTITGYRGGSVKR